MFKKFVVLMLVLAASALTFNAYACEHNADSKPCEHNAGTKLGRGISNISNCLMEIPKQIFLVSKEREVASGILYGTVKGVCYTVLRAATGVYDTVTFLIPPYGETLMDPEFAFEGWDESKS